MVLEVREITPEKLTHFLEQANRHRPKKTLADVYGGLKRGLDGLEYQKAIRNEWN
ncbi:MAG: hypothetical protein LBS63_02210 [Prevotellaceae bacterium]|jgi:hypothetical protein|nr:hypothetical protein [Prevotellaceae bacterium]